MFPENWLTSSQNRLILFSSAGGLILIGLGIFYLKGGFNLSSTKVEILQENSATESGKILTVEIAGAVEKPGVYKLSGDSRIEDLLLVSGGFSGGADRSWADKYLNRAAKLTDGQKVYIPSTGEQIQGASAKTGGVYQSGSSNFSSDSKGLISINSASLKELDSLPDIGPARAQNIIDHRPYSNVEELLTKGVLKKKVYEGIKDLVTVY